MKRDKMYSLKKEMLDSHLFIISTIHRDYPMLRFEIGNKHLDAPDIERILIDFYFSIVRIRFRKVVAKESHEFCHYDNEIFRTKDLSFDDFFKEIPDIHKEFFLYHLDLLQQ